MKTGWKSFLADAGAEFEDDRLVHFGNAERERRVAVSGLVFADLSHLGVIAVHGADAGTFLQAQFSNDVDKVTESSSQLNAYSTPKGRMLGLMRVFRRGDGYYLRLPADTLEAVIQRLRMYVMRAEVTLEDVSDNFIALGVSGEQAAAQLAEIAGAVPGQVNEVAHDGDITLLRVPGVQPRYEVYMTSLQAAQRCWDSLNVHGAPVGEPVWRLLEIDAGLPAVYAATRELFVPQMANLQLVDGVSFKKGCYPGQEIVARMQYLGTLKRRMYRGTLATDSPVSPGDSLFGSDDAGQPVGRIVDAQPCPDGGQRALAVIQIQSAEGGDLHLGAADGPLLTLASLPYEFADD